MGIGVLGPLTIDGSPPPLPRRDRVVLEALVVETGVPVSAERLADAVWRGTLPVSWPKVVQSSIVRLRKLLGRHVIETLPEGYRLTLPPHDIDACEFERLVDRSREQLLLGQAERASYTLDEALRLWRGRPLNELTDWDRGRTEADRLEELRRDAEELRAEAGLEAGHHRELLVELQRLVRAAPLRERRWELLALAEYRAGRQGDALRTVRQVRQLLLDELGLDPGPALLALEQSILRQDDALSIDDADPGTASAPPCPYPGLVPYDIGDADTFFGREDDVAACLDRLRRSGVLAVVGPSGSGKSSLLRAGVAATRRREGARVVVVTPGSRPREALTAPAGRPGGLLVVVDQCEEVFSLCDDRDEQRAFFAELAAHCETGEVALALRADRLGDLAGFPDATRLVERGLYLLNPMDEDDLRAAIEAPARQAGLRIEPGLVELLIAEVAGEPGSLPLMSHVLRETWTRRERTVLTVDGYRATGGVRRAVAASAEALYEQVSLAERPVLRDLLLRLVSPTDEGDPVRMKVPRRLLAGDPSRDRLVEELVRARLVTSDDGVVEVAHEALSRAWPRLRGWLDEDTEGQRILRHLAVAADTWDSMGRPDSELYRGTRLARALDWRDQAVPDLTPVERGFLEAGRQLADAEERSAAEQARYQARVNRRLRALLVAGAVLLVLALVGGMLALDQRGQARRAAAAADLRTLRAQALAEPRLDVALLLAAQALVRDGSDESRAALLEVARRAAPAVGVLPATDRLLALDLDARGRRLAATGSEGTGRVWDVRSRDVLATLPLGLYGATSVDLSADGRFLVAVDAPLALSLDRQGIERRVVVVDLAAAEPAPRPLSGPALSAATFGPDGRTLLTLGIDGRLRSIDPMTGKASRPPTRANGPPTPLIVESTALESSADRRVVVAYDTVEPNLLTVWDVRSRRVRWAQRQPDGVVAAVDPTGRFVVVGHTDGRIERVDLRNPRRRVAVQSFLGGALTDVAWAPDGSTFAGATPRGTVAVWDARSLEPAATLGGASGRVTQLGYTPDGGTLYAAGEERAVMSWDLTGRRGLAQDLGSTSPAGAIGSALSGDGSTVATALGDGSVRVRSLADGGSVVFEQLVRGGPGGMVVDHRGRRIALLDSGWPGEGTVLVRVRDAGRPAAAGYDIPLTPGRGFDATFSGDGRRLVTVDDDVVTVHDARDGRPAEGFVGYRAGGPVGYLGVDSSADIAAAVTAEGAVEIADLRTGQRLAVLRRESTPSAQERVYVQPRFSPDGRWLAIGSDSGMMTLWRTSAWEVAARWLAVPGGAVDSLAFSPDSRRLVVGGAGEAASWPVDGSPGTPLRVSADPLAAGGAVNVAAGVDTVTTHTDAAGTWQWPLSTRALLRHACAVAGRDLTAEERDAVLPRWSWEPICG